MSSESSEETFEQHRKLRTRAEDYVHKPIAFGELLQHIQAFVQLGAAPRRESDAAIVIDDDDRDRQHRLHDGGRRDADRAAPADGDARRARAARHGDRRRRRRRVRRRSLRAPHGRRSRPGAGAAQPRRAPSTTRTPATARPTRADGAGRRRAPSQHGALPAASSARPPSGVDIAEYEKAPRGARAHARPRDVAGDASCATRATRSRSGGSRRARSSG